MLSMVLNLGVSRAYGRQKKNPNFCIIFGLFRLIFWPKLQYFGIALFSAT